MSHVSHVSHALPGRAEIGISRDGVGRSGRLGATAVEASVRVEVLQNTQVSTSHADGRPCTFWQLPWEDAPHRRRDREVTSWTRRSSHCSPSLGLAHVAARDLLLSVTHLTFPLALPLKFY